MSKYQTSELNVRREYLQNLFLSYFYQQPESDAIFFKRGTLLRIGDRSPRFSGDLDFSSTLSDTNEIEKVVKQTLIAIERNAISTEIKESKPTTNRSLAIITCDLQGTVIPIQIKVSFREGKKEGEVLSTINNFVPTYIVIALKQEQFVHEKIQALLTRQKPRDFYDLYYLIRANMVSEEERKNFPKALDTLQKSNIQFDAELQIFLPKSNWAVIRSFKNALENELKRYV